MLEVAGHRFLSQPRTIKTSVLKQFALDTLPAGCTLKEVLLADKDEMPVDEFLFKIPLWLVLLRQVKA